MGLSRSAQKQVSSPAELKMELIENAIDYIVVGVEIYFSYDDRPQEQSSHQQPFFGNPDPDEGPYSPSHWHETSHQRLFTDPVRRRKHAMLNLFSGTLLLLKERLRRIHPNLLYTDIGKRPKKGSKTIDFDETVSRIQSLVGSSTLSERQRRLLDNAQKVRNSVEHHALEESRYKLDHIIPRLVEFADEFAVKELEIDILHRLDQDTREHVSQLKGVAERLAQEEEARCRAVLARVRRLTDEELDELADVEPYHPKHNPDPVEFLYCDACGEMSVVVVEEGQAAVCTQQSCREGYLMSTCLRCEAPVGYGDSLCEGCCAYLERQ